ncbi:MAG: chromate transporter [Clostridia bacterium]|nr:chromate transporter [Clostridia bacterium]
MLYITMFLEFFKVGLFSIGGGLATLPFLFDLTRKYDWFTAEELTNMIAVSESSPGPIGVNMATYAGVTTGGVIGGVISTLGLIIPSIIVILVISYFLEKFKENKTVKSLFYGLRAAVTGLLTLSVLTIFKQNFLTENAGSLFEMIDFKKLILFALLVFASLKFKKHPIVYIIAGAVCGILLGF